MDMEPVSSFTLSALQVEDLELARVQLYLPRTPEPAFFSLPLLPPTAQDDGEARLWSGCHTFQRD